MEHRADRPDDLLPRGRRAHPGAPRPARQVRVQDPDAHQDRPQLQDAVSLSARGLLLAQGDRRPGHALDGPHPDPAVGPEVRGPDRPGRDALPRRDDPRGGGPDPDAVPVHPALGGRVRRLAARLGRVRAQARRGAGAEPAPDARGPRGLVGPRHPAHQHAVPEGPPHAGLRQGLARAVAVPRAPGRARQPVLVDARAPRRQAVEPQQLPHGRDPGPRGRRGDPGAHAVQGDGVPDLGGPVLGEGIRVRGEHEVRFGGFCAFFCRGKTGGGGGGGGKVFYFLFFAAAARPLDLDREKKKKLTSFFLHSLSLSLSAPTPLKTPPIPTPLKIPHPPTHPPPTTGTRS